MEVECDRVDHVGELEGEYLDEYPERVVETDKAWDAMHRVLSDGELSPEGGEYPLNHVVLGGEQLYTDQDHFIALKTPAQVKEVSAALPAIDRTEFRRRYDEIDEYSYEGELSNQDFDYTWENFQDVRRFFRKAAAEGRYVLFTADQ